MKDRYLFRGKSTLTGCFSIGMLDLNTVGEYFVNDSRVHPETIGQCTGLKDKNGTLIYEGDILEWGQAGQEGIITVEWFADEGRWGMPNSSITKIIGNVHDNPELLEEEI